MNDFPVQCTCGAIRIVPRSDAGADYRCHCGLVVAVPGLDEFADGAAARMGPPTPEKSIPEMVHDGRLPPEACPTCGLSSVELIELEAQCERSFIEQNAELALAFGMGGHMAAAARSEQKRRGRDLVVPVPIRLCRTCRDVHLPGLHGHVLVVVGLVSTLMALPLLAWSGWIALGAALAGPLLALIGWCLLRRRQRQLIALLSHVPEYGQLFEKYEDAVIRLVLPIPE